MSVEIGKDRPERPFARLGIGRKGRAPVVERATALLPIGAFDLTHYLVGEKKTIFSGVGLCTLTNTSSICRWSRPDAAEGSPMLRRTPPPSRHRSDHGRKSRGTGQRFRCRKPPPTALVQERIERSMAQLDRRLVNHPPIL